MEVEGEGGLEEGSTKLGRLRGAVEGGGRGVVRGRVEDDIVAGLGRVVVRGRVEDAAGVEGEVQATMTPELYRAFITRQGMLTCTAKTAPRVHFVYFGGHNIPNLKAVQFLAALTFCCEDCTTSRKASSVQRSGTSTTRATRLWASFCRLMQCSASKRIALPSGVRVGRFNTAQGTPTRS